MNKTFLLVTILCSFLLLAGNAEPAPEGLPKGAKLVDFGMRRFNPEKKNLGEITWLTDFVGTAPAASDKPAKPRKKALVLSFWATWCKPCVEEMPFLQGMYEKYADKGLQVLGVNFRKESEKFDGVFAESRKIIEEKKVTYPMLFDRYTSRNQLVYVGSKAILPTLVIIDAGGTIVEKYQGEKTRSFKEIEKKIQELLDR